MSIVNDKSHGVIGIGYTRPMVDGAFTGSGTIERNFTSIAGSVMCSVFVRSASGTVDISLRTSIKGDRIEDVEIITFPTISSPTSEILIKQSAVCLSILTLIITYSDDCDILVAAQGIRPGQSSAKILGAASIKATQVTVTTTPVSLFPVDITDREGLLIKNNSSSGILYIAESAAACLTSSAWPIAAGDSLGVGLASGQTVYGRSSTGTIDARMLESGG